jgi:amino acid permease
MTHDLGYVINIIIYYLNQALVLLMGLAIIIFVWYVIQYFIRPNEDRTNASSYVMWSLIGFFVILSFWGLVNILQNTFGLQNSYNRPASWADFSNLFPTGSGSGNPSSFNNGNGSVVNYNLNASLIGR